MATRANVAKHEERISTYTWAGMLNGDDGDAVDVSDADYMSIQQAGVAGVGYSPILYGCLSSPPVDFNQTSGVLTLSAVFLAALAGSAGVINMFTVPPNLRFVRPRVAAGDGTTAVTFVLSFKRRYLRS